MQKKETQNCTYVFLEYELTYSKKRNQNRTYLLVILLHRLQVGTDLHHCLSYGNLGIQGLLKAKVIGRKHN